MTEKKFYTNRIKPLLDGIQGLEYSRIEVKGLARGVPDITYSYNGHHGWVEMKYVNKIVKPHYPFRLTRELTPTQRLWLTLRGAIGGHCWVFLGTSDYFFVFKHENINKLFVNNSKITWGEVGALASYVCPINDIDPVAVAAALA